MRLSATNAGNRALGGAASVALFGLIYALEFLTRCLADVDGASGK